MSELRAGILFLVALGAAQAQIYPGGGYPGGGYPGGGYPGGGYPGQYPYPGGRGGTGIPIPQKGSTQPSKNASEPLPNFRGKLKQMDAKTITLELGDNRVLEFKRTDKTKFYKGGEELKTPEFKTGDQVSIEGPEDSHGYMVAVNVYWEKSAAAAQSSDEKAGAVDTWKDAPGESGPVAAEKATEVTPPPAKPDPNDPGPPKLQRGKPADSAREHAPAPPADAPVAAPVATPAAAPATAAAAAPVAANLPPRMAAPPPSEAAEPSQPSIVRGDEDAAPSFLRSDDPLIRKAANAALDFTETLPNYVCQEMMARYQSETRPANFQALDVVSTEVVYENGKEDYRNIMVNGKASKKSLEDTGGSWSTGEFGTVLIDLFSPGTAADFHYQRDSRAGSVLAKMYEFDVARENSHWSVHAGSQMYIPAYSGAVWIDPKTSRVLRIEMSAKGMPGEFPLDEVESATDYEYIRLGDAQQYLLPVHAETLSCQRGSNLCAKNIIDFRNYHKYTGESNIKFGDTVKQDKP
jgi:hypothetical protein